MGAVQPAALMVRRILVPAVAALGVGVWLAVRPDTANMGRMYLAGLAGLLSLPST